VARALRRLGRDPPHPGAAPPSPRDWDPDLATSHPGLAWAVARWGGRRYECGARGEDEVGRGINNQCFYLSLAAAVRGTGEADARLALRLKRLFEASVRLVRGAHYDLQADAGAYADFLAPALTSYSPLRSRAVAVIDGEAGSIQVYRAPATLDPDSPVLALFFSNAHYQWVRWEGGGPTAAALASACYGPGPPGAPLAPVPHLELEATPPVLIILDD